MDWPKAKNILILALLLTNIFLIWTLFSFTPFEAEEEDQFLIEETIHVLAQNQILMEAEIPIQKKQASVLSIIYDDHIGTFVYPAVPLPEGVFLTTNEAEKIATDFLKDQNLFPSSCILMKSERNVTDLTSFTITFGSFIDGIQIENCYAICTVSGEGVSKLERFWLNPDSYGKNEKTIIPATTALLKFMISKPNLKEPLTITEVSLVYRVESTYTDLSQTTSDTAFPYWRIKCSDESITFISAFEQQ